MQTLNYKHLRYFWMVAKSGSIARASEQLHLTPQSISGQLSEFESTLGVDLFRRVGRGLELTETGQRMLGYAEQIFSLGGELLDSIRNEAHQQSITFRVGIADSVPKMVAYRLVQPSLHLDEPVRLICREGRLATLLADLAVHRLDMVIADRPMPAGLNAGSLAGSAAFSACRTTKTIVGRSVSGAEMNRSEASSESIQER
jgi:LysR family transcriptional activator of nhaA